MADQSNLEHSAGVATAANGTTSAGNTATEDKSEGADSTKGSSLRPPDVEPYDQEGEDDPEDVDAELEAMKKRLKEMEDEANAVKAAGAGGTDGTSAATGRADRMGEDYGASLIGPSAESDARSIYVGNVDYAATPEELQAHFADCGTINRVTIMCNKATGTPKGFAYIEFVDQDAVKNAVILNESPFRGRALKVTPKRTNVPGLAVRGGRGGRGRGVFGYRGRGFGRGRPRGRWVPY